MNKSRHGLEESLLSTHSEALTEMENFLAGSVGADKVEFKLFHNYKHAADQLYSDENLGILKEYLDEKFA